LGQGRVQSEKEEKIKIVRVNPVVKSIQTDRIKSRGRLRHEFEVTNGPQGKKKCERAFKRPEA